MYFRSLVPVLLLSTIALVAACSEAKNAAATAFDKNNDVTGSADKTAVTVTSSSARNSAVAADETSVVFVQDNGDVFTFPTAASVSTPTKLGTFQQNDGEHDSVQLGLDANFIYFAVSDDRISRMPRAGGAPETLLDHLAALNDGTFILLPDSIIVETTSTTLQKIDKTTKAVVDFATSPGKIGGFTVDSTGDKLWLSDLDNGNIGYIALTATLPATPTIVVTGQQAPGSMGFGPDYVYWANGILGDNPAIQHKLLRTKSDGSQTTADVIGDDEGYFASPIFADATYVYAGSVGQGVFRAPATGGGTLAPFLGLTLSDFTITNNLVVAVENNVNKTSSADRNAPNRVLAASK